MITIHRFPLLFIPNTQITTAVYMPKGAQIKHFGVSPSDELSLWALVDTTKQPEERTFQLFRTGQSIIEEAERYSEEFAFVGSCFDGPFVWHLFERP